MGKLIRILLLVIFALLTVHATCAPAARKAVVPKEMLAFDDEVYYHNMSITYGDHYYYTLNGGNESWGLVNEYKANGELVESHDVELDGRSIFYNSDDEQLYVKIYGTDLYTVDPEEGYCDVKLEGIFEEDNSSPGFDPKARYIYEFVYGRVRVLDFEDGEELRSFNVDDYYDEHGYNTAVAASENYLYLWSSEDAIQVYDLDGDFVRLIKLPRPGYGFSLSYCHGYLWISKDADGGEEGATGRWFGYKL
jgi:hypothetical protein